MFLDLWKGQNTSKNSMRFKNMLKNFGEKIQPWVGGGRTQIEFQWKIIIYSPGDEFIEWFIRRKDYLGLHSMYCMYRHITVKI
jgi:hypothetical protein